MKKEKRKLSFKIDIRSSENEGKKFVEGIIPYDSKSVPIWGVTEYIDKAAFNKTLLENDVRALWNHNDNFILGNTKSKTLVLENTESGLICRCELPNTSYANDLYEIIDRGDVKTMSFGFTPIKWEDSESGKKRTLKEVQLHEVSFGVTFPAYQETTSVTYMRNMENRKINVEKLDEILGKDDFDDNDKSEIQNTINILNNLIKTEVKTIEQPKEDIKPEETIVEPTKEDNSGLLLQIETELTLD
jgi:HK97 family phage prohead protease